MRPGAALVPMLVAACASFHEDSATPDAHAPRLDAALRDARLPDATHGRDAPETSDVARPVDAKGADAAPGPAWSAEVSGVFGDDLNAVWGSSATDVYAVGGNGTIVHSKGDGVWTTQPSQFAIGSFLGVWGSGATQVYAVTDAGYICSSVGTGTWSCSTVAQDLTAVCGPAAESYYYVVSQLGVITRVTGPMSQVSEEDTGGAFGFFGIWGSSATDVYAAADDGQIFHSTGTGTWTSEPGGQMGAGGTVWGSSAADVYAAGGTVLYHSSGGGTWTIAPTPTSVTVTLSGVWGSAASDVYVVGDRGTVLHTTGAGAYTTEVTASSSNLFAVWGSGAGDVYAVGSGGAILHRNPPSP